MTFANVRRRLVQLLLPVASMSKLTEGNQAGVDIRRYTLLHGCIGNAIIAQVAIQQYIRSMPNRPSK